MLSAFIEDCDKNITRFSSIDTVIECLKERKLPKLLSDLHILLKLYLTVPSSNPSAERSLSGLRRVKSYLRSTLTQRHLNYYTILHVHKDLRGGGGGVQAFYFGKNDFELAVGWDGRTRPDIFEGGFGSIREILPM